MANGGIKVSMKMEGLDGLRLMLKDLPEGIQSRVLSGAVAKGALFLRNKAREIVRVSTGLLRRNIFSTRGVRRDTEASSFVFVKVLTKKAIARFKKKTGKAGKENPDDPFYWSILEFGKSTRTAHPFIRPAFEQNKEEAARVIGEALAKGIDAEVKKLRWS